MCYEGKPFLSEPGNLGLILNFDFFQPYEHLSYSLGAIHVGSKPSLWKQVQARKYYTCWTYTWSTRTLSWYKQLFVDDLIKFWDGVEMRIASSNCTRKIHRALMIVSWSSCGSKNLVFWDTVLDWVALDAYWGSGKYELLWIWQGELASTYANRA